MASPRRARSSAGGSCRSCRGRGRERREWRRRRLSRQKVIWRKRRSRRQRERRVWTGSRHGRGRKSARAHTAGRLGRPRGAKHGRLVLIQRRRDAGKLRLRAVLFRPILSQPRSIRGLACRVLEHLLRTRIRRDSRILSLQFRLVCFIRILWYVCGRERRDASQVLVL